MKPQALKYLVCPRCKDDLYLATHTGDEHEILQGSLSCRACQAVYSIRDCVPRFVEEDSYASSFGRQWSWFRTVQLDSLNGTTASEKALFATTGWQDADYQGPLVLAVAIKVVWAAQDSKAARARGGPRPDWGGATGRRVHP